MEQQESIQARLDRLIGLYEGAITLLDNAVEAIRGGQKGEMTTSLQRGKGIISTFQSTLDHSQGGQVAQQLHDLYAFMLDSLTQAEKDWDPQPIQRVMTQLRTLLDGWRGAQLQIASDTQL
jgi:flagellar protein FliS